MVQLFFFFEVYGVHRDQPLLTHSFPTRRSAVLLCRHCIDARAARVRIRFAAPATGPVDANRERGIARDVGVQLQTDRTAFAEAVLAAVAAEQCAGDGGDFATRSEERRGGKECVSTWRSRGWRDNKKKKKH